ncbi:MAG: tyrosine-type recombinase/integrase [Dehalococcoidia bacterium]
MRSAAGSPARTPAPHRRTVAPPRGLSADAIRRLLAVIPETPVGLRDRAIILTLTLTGRRRAEVMGMTAGDLSMEDGRVWYAYRGKGGKTGKRELPQPAYGALTAALSAFWHDIATMGPDASLWPARRGDTRGIRSGTFYGNLQRYFRLAGLPPAGVHPALGHKAPTSTPAEHRGRLSVPRPQLARGHDGLPAPAGGAGRHGMGERGGGHRRISARRGAACAPHRHGSCRRSACGGPGQY